MQPRLTEALLAGLALLGISGLYAYFVWAGVRYLYLLVQ